MAETIDQTTAPQQQMVNLIDPDSGEVGAVPQQHAPQYVEQGYRQATPEETDAFVNDQKYGGAGQQAVTGLEGAGQAATFGLSTAAERAAGVPKEDIIGRREANPVTHMAGQAAGLIGSSMLIPGGGAAGLMDMAGGAAAEAAGMQGAGLLAKTGSALVKGAVENAMFQAGDEASKTIADPNRSVQTAITEIGLAGLIGGGISGAFGVVSPLWKATTGDKLGSWMEAIQRRANGESVPLSENLQKAIQDTGGVSGVDALGLPPEIRAGVSDVPDLAKQFNLLQESKTMPGQNLKQTLEDFNKSASDHIVKSLGKDAESIASMGEISHFDAGQAVQDDLSSELKKSFEPIVEKFDEIKDKFSKIPLSSTEDAVADKLAIKADEEGWLKAPRSPEFKLYNDVLAELPLQETLEDLRKFQSNMWSRGRENPALYPTIGKISSILEDVEYAAMERHAGAKGEQQLADLALAKSAYRSAKETIEALNERLHVGKYGGPSTFVKALKEMKPEEIVSRLSRPNDAGLIQLLQKEFPSVAQKIKDYQLSKLLGNAATKAPAGHAINMRTFFTNYDKMTPEMRGFVMSPEAQKSIAGVRTLLDAIPKYKSSGTAGNLDALWSKVPGGAMAMLSMVTGHNPAVGFMLGQTAKWVSRDAPDAVRLGFLKFLGHDGAVEPEAFKTMVDFIQSTIKGQNKVVKGAEAVFKAGKLVLPETQMPDKRDRDRLDKKLKALQKDPSALLNTGGKTSHYLPEHGEAMGMTASNAVGYLNSLRPNTDKQGPLDSTPKVDKTKQSEYDRALDIAQQPLIVLKNVKDGTVTSKDIEHLKSLYPDLYSSMTSQLMDHIVSKENDEEPLPYKTRLALSLFMGQPLDSTMSQQATQLIQMSFAMPHTQPGAQQSPKTQHSMNGLSKMASNYQTPQQARMADKAKA